MRKYNRFTMEENIMAVWGVLEDLDTLAEGVMEYDLSKDQVTNALMGMKELYELKFNKLWDEFERGIRE